MTDDNFGFYEEPKNGDDIIRARTTSQIRSWDMPRSERALQRFNLEIGELEFPGLYILFAKNKTYVGEAKSLHNRIKTHMKTPEDKIRDWNRVLIINDGRPATQSNFNDTVIRKALEIYLIRLLKANKYEVLAQGETQILNSQQKHSVDSLVLELNAFLKKKNIIMKELEEQGQEEIFSDELKKILEKKSYSLGKWGADEAIINGDKAFIRPGSNKSKGWQITIRGGKPGSFIDAFRRGVGFLLVPRDGVLFIPLKYVQKVITDKNTYKQDTIDIYIVFKDDNVTLSYTKNTIDVTQYRLLNK